MILTCPECATSYFVDEAKVPSTGRTVKCANCGARWTATPTLAEEAPEPELLVEAEPELTMEAEPVEAAAAEGGASAERPGDALPKLFRAKADTNRKVREAAAMGVVWAVTAVVVAGVIGAAIVFRADLVRAWPKSAAAFAAIGLPVNSLSLGIEGVRAEPVLRNGHAALLVKGMIRNIGDKPVTAPPIRIKLLNGQGRAVAEKIAHWSHPLIPPGESRLFNVPMIDPPSTSKDVEVAFAPEVNPTPAKHAPAKAKAPAHGGEAAHPEPAVRPAPALPAPVEAQPLAPDDPNAVHPHG